MFGMDMALGADLMDRGAMDMGIGAMDMRMGEMDMAMGNPILGADMMAMGAMDMRAGEMQMGMGMGLMDRGMMMGGVGMGGMGMMQVGMMGRGMGFCPPGCMMACCRPPVVVCPPGCMGSCCFSKQVIVRNVQPQYSNDGFVQLPPVPRAQYPQPPQRRVYETTAGNADIQEQIINQQARIEMEKNQQMLYKQQLQQERLQIQRQKLELQQKLIEQQRMEQARLQQLQEQQRLQKVKQQVITQDLYNYQKTNSFALDQQQYPPQNPYGNETLLQGDIYQQNFGQWEQVRGTLTTRTLLGLNLQNICKIKVKYATHVPNYRIMKLTVVGRGDFFIAVPAQDQLQWMCKIVWARFNKINRIFNPNQPFTGSYEGEIVRKSFFNGWQAKFASISNAGLKMRGSLGGPVTHTITAVPEIWTRFDIVHGNKLIIKFHALGRKNEIGIPIEHAIPWLRGLYTLIRPG